MRTADNLITFMCLMSRNSGSLKLPVTEGLDRACSEMALPSIRTLNYFNTDEMYLFAIRVRSFNIMQLNFVCTGLILSHLLHCLSLQITQLKIDNNPFAKGFRDTGAGKREKK